MHMDENNGNLIILSILLTDKHGRPVYRFKSKRFILAKANNEQGHEIKLLGRPLGSRSLGCAVRVTRRTRAKPAYLLLTAP